MKRFLARIGLPLCFASLLILPGSLVAQKTNPPAPETKAGTPSATAPAKKPSAGPFHGKLGAVHLEAKTIQVGKRTFHITGETKLYKGGKPATLAEAVVGEVVSGYVKPTDDGKLWATTVNLGPKPAPAKKTAK